MYNYDDFATETPASPASSSSPGVISPITALCRMHAAQQRHEIMGYPQTQPLTLRESDWEIVRSQKPSVSRRCPKFKRVLNDDFHHFLAKMRCLFNCFKIWVVTSKPKCIRLTCWIFHFLLHLLKGFQSLSCENYSNTRRVGILHCSSGSAHVRRTKMMFIELVKG